ncbi:IKI3 family-domain-containing protein [Catenaria anguillulae PL171]|uniref:IKI3 family-domain-containing protein n=1 Tax=Catenaria anguillulae PL171 TaxID=765915 RepID=A0A1Y2HAH9_9FUNG|nr:IKI3 family-domain-containing protein [Catenaria anguillulae PL171]
MKSLVLLRESAATLTQLPQAAALALTHDPVSHTAFFAAFDPHADPDLLSIVAIDPTTSSPSPSSIISTVPIPIPLPQSSTDDCDALPSLSPPDIACFHYLADSSSLFLALADSGSLYSIPVSGSAPATLIGTIHSGLASATWSPDEDLLVLVTRAGNYLLMTRDFDVLLEAPLQTDSFGEQVPVSIGWGKKETQFHGSAGKAAALAKPTGDARLSPWDDEGARVAWNGDGSGFVVSSVDWDPVKDTRKRSIRVYSREGALQATSQAVDLLEHSLAWRPAGNLVAGAQRSDGGSKYQVVFFEPNGLRHGEFTLRGATDAVVVREMAWNCDSTVLAVWVWDEAQARDKVQLWTMGNYHWYLKQELDFEGGLIGFEWDTMHPLTLHLALRSGMYRCMQFTWDVIRQNVTGLDHAASVGVVDGSAVLHTPFALANVPPPYSLNKLQVTQGENVKMVAWCAEQGYLERVAVVHGRNTDIKVKVFDMQDDKGRRMGAIGTDIDLSPIAHLSLRQLHFPTYSSLVFLGYNLDTQTDHLVRATINGQGDLLDVATTPLPFPVLRLATVPTSDLVVIQDTQGQLQIATWDHGLSQYVLGDDDRDVGEPLAFDTPCEWMAIVPTSTTPDTLSIVGLTSRSKLVLATRNSDGSTRTTQLGADASSFVLHAEYLIYTTLAHQVHFLPLTSLLNSSSVPTSSSADPSATLTRAIERGAHLITVLPLGTNLVLQMPRGNLETIAPRPLVLDTTVRAMRAGDWKAAFTLVRKHRIEFNLLADYDLDTFLAATETWVEQLDSSDHVNLVLSNLKDDVDVVAEVYPWIHYPTRPAATLGVGKVARICTRVRDVLSARAGIESTSWVTTLITTHVKSSPPAIESALALVKHLATTSPATDAADRALKYTCFLVPVDKLYDVALGMYDFALTLMVAQRSNKDPREYLPWLQELRRVPDEFERRWRIDCALGRVERAVANGLRAVETTADQGGQESSLWAKVKTYIREKDMYAVAVQELLQVSPNGGNAERERRLTQVLLMFGNHLAHTMGKHAQAGHVFEMGGHLAEAMAAYEKAGEWRKVLSVAARRAALPPSAIPQVVDDEEGQEEQEEQVDVGRVAVQLAQTLMERAEHEAAAAVLVEYVGDVEQAVEQWIKAGKWSEAERQAYLHARPDLIDTHLRPGLLAGASSMLTVLDEMRSDLHARIARLTDVRAEKKAKLAAFESGSNSGAHDPSLTNVDALSDTTSMMSTFTGLTLATASTARTSTSSRKSSKTRRKNERKRHAGKKGSIYEEEYLVDSSHKCMARIAEFVGEVRALLSGLVAAGYLAEARRVQTAYVEAIDAAIRDMKVVTDPPEPHPLQRQVDRYRLMVDEGLTEEQAEARLDAMERAQRREAVKMPELADWQMSVLDM